MRELPEGWTKAEIGSLCSLENGRAFKPTDWTTTGFPIVRIQNLNNPNASFNYFNQQVDERYFLRGGELLFAWSGTPGTSFGAHVWKGGEAVLNQHIFRVDLNYDLVEKRFFRFAINQKLNELIGIAHGGVGLRHVTKGKFESTEVVLPPINEQKRIADRLDQLLTRIDKTKAHLDRIPPLLKRFRQSVLAAATSGKLTEDWRETSTQLETASELLIRVGNDIKKKSTKLTSKSTISDVLIKYREDSDLPTTWQITQVGNICKNSFYGPRFGKDEYVAEGIPSIRTTDMTDKGDIQLKNPPMLNIPANKLDDFKLLPGDLLVTRSGSVGVMAIFKDSYLAVPSAYLIRFRFSELILIDYIFHYLRSPFGQKLMGLSSTAVTQTNINAEAIKNLPIPIPPIEEQQEIVRRVEALFAKADRIEAQYKNARQQVDRLTPALLAKAFRGELVPQDPNDEPASVLLERVKEARSATQPAKAKRKTVK